MVTAGEHYGKKKVQQPTAGQYYGGQVTAGDYYGQNLGPWGRWGLRKLQEQVGEPRKIYSGRTMMDILDTLMIPWYAGTGALQGIFREAREGGRPLFQRGPQGEEAWQQGLWGEMRGFGRGAAAIPGGMWRGIKERAGVGGIIEEEAPRFAAKHPLATGALGLAGDIALLKPVAGLTRAGLGAAAKGLAIPARGAGKAALKVPALQRAWEAAPGVAGKGIYAIESGARRLMGEGRRPSERLLERAAEAGLEPQVSYVVRAWEGAMDDALRAGEVGLPAKGEQYVLRARELERQLGRATALREKLEAAAEARPGQAAERIEALLGPARGGYVAARRAEGQSASRFAKLARERVEALRREAELAARPMSEAERAARVDPLLRHYDDLTRELGELEEGVLKVTADMDMQAMARETDAMLRGELERRISDLRGAPEWQARRMYKNKAGDWVIDNRARPVGYVSGDDIGEMADALQMQPDALMKRLRDLVRENAAKTERFQLFRGGRARGAKEWGELDIGFTSSEMRAALRGLKAEAGMVRRKMPRPPEMVAYGRAESELERLSTRLTSILEEAEKGYPDLWRAPAEWPRLDEARKAWQATKKAADRAAAKALRLEQRWARAGGREARIPGEPAVQERLLREAPGARGAVAGAPARETAWERAVGGLDIEREVPEAAPRLTPAQKALQAREAEVALEAEYREVLRQGQEAGLTERMMRRGLSRQDVAKLRQVGRTRATEQMQPRAQEGMDAALDRVKRMYAARAKRGVISQEEAERLSGEIESIVKGMQYEGVRRTVRELQTGALTKEQVQRYGKFHIARRWQAYDDPMEWVAERVAPTDPALAADVRAIVNRWKALGAASERQVMRRASKAARKGLPEDAKAMLGELPVRYRFRLSQRLKALASSEAYRLREFREGYGITAEQYRALSEAERRLYTTMPDAARFGVLRSTKEAPTFVPKWMAAHLGVTMEGAGWENRIARLMSWGLPAQAGEMRHWYFDTVIGTWKWIHVPASLPTVLRNVYTNAIMTYIVGKVPPHLIPTYLWRGAKSVWEHDGQFQLASRINPGFGGTFRAAELPMRAAEAPRALAAGAGANPMEAALSKIVGGARTLRDKASGAYEFAEQSSKMAVFLYHTERGGLKAAEAGRIAVEAIFDYGDVSRVTNWLRRSGAYPFATFPIKATRVIGKTYMEAPERVGAAALFSQAPGKMIPASEAEAIDATMDPADRGRIVPIPYLTASDERAVMDVGYIVPWGPWGQPPGLLDLGALPRTIEDIARNKSSFTEREIYPPEAEWGEKRMAEALYALDSLTPGWIMRGIPRVVQSFREEKPRFGLEPEAITGERIARTAVGEFLGLRTRPYVPEQQMMFRRLRVRQARANIERELGAALRKITGTPAQQRRAQRKYDELYARRMARLERMQRELEEMEQRYEAAQR